MGNSSRKFLSCLTVGLAFAFATGLASAISPPDDLHGTLEQYFTASNGQKASGNLRWLQLNEQISSAWGATAGWYQEWGEQELDEASINYDSPAVGFRVGRIRSQFGFSSWSDQHYSPFIALPAIRSYIPVGGDLNLYRLDRGIEAGGGKAALQYNVDLVDSDEGSWKVLPDRVNTAIGRIQWATGPLILGLNGLVKDSNHLDYESKVVDLDFRCTIPRLILRGELISGAAHGEGSRGFYADLLYRPVGLARTQVGVRFQGIDYTGYYGWWGYKADLYTFGARQILCKNVTFDLNYGAGDRIPSSYGIRGWSAQLTTSFSF